MFAKSSIRRSIRSSKQYRTFSIQFSEEIQNALNNKQPIVALESTIITHGLPYPKNAEMAFKVEEVIRSNGAVPATVAFINGKPSVGLKTLEIEALAQNKNVNKVSRRDIGYTMANKINGGTTVSATMIVAEKLGIKVFATGGLGGVHKGAETTFDVSADLTELGRTKMAVVCAGPKSILDVPKTIEYLETQGCFVSTFGPQGTNIPGFFTQDSGIKSPYNFQTVKEAAEIVYNGIDLLNLNSGYLFCAPPPKEYSMDSNYINNIINEAEEEASNLRIKGKDLTPFLLSKIANLTKGSSVDTNLQVVFNNAKIAAGIAVELSKLEVYQPIMNKVSTKIDKASLKMESLKTTSVDIVIIGSVAIDLICQLTLDKVHLGDSNPGSSNTSIGGVAYNVFLATNLLSKDKKIRLISQVGKDEFGKIISNEFKEKNFDTEGLIENPEFKSGKYISIHDKKGDLIIACADMKIAENFQDDLLIEKFKQANPKITLIDGNIGISSMNKVIKTAFGIGSKVIFEPTSSIKCKKISKVIKSNPTNFIFNNNHLENLINGKYSNMSGLILATPTMEELREIHNELDNDELFDINLWFPILDAMGINSEFRNKLDGLNNMFIRKIIEKGILQQSFKLLPYIPSLIIKCGENGILIINLTTKIQQFKDKLESNDEKPNLTITCKGKTINENNQLGVLIEYFEIPEKISNIKNVTGAGDSLVGCLINELSNNADWLFENGELRNKIVTKSQIVAGLSLQSDNSVNEKISKL